jgi:hypothetical protein
MRGINTDLMEFVGNNERNFKAIATQLEIERRLLA